MIIYSFSFHNQVEINLSRRKSKETILGMFQYRLPELHMKRIVIQFILCGAHCAANDQGSGFESIIYHTSKPIYRRKGDLIRKRQEGCKTSKSARVSAMIYQNFPVRVRNCRKIMKN